MAGEITASAPVICDGVAALEVAIEALVLAAATDTIIALAIPGRDNQFVVFKAERAA